jgi:hypothetical protein
MKKYTLITLTLLVLLSLQSCQKDEIIGGTAVEKMAGDWYVKYSDDGGLTYHDDYYKFSTFNTSSNSSSEMWIDDLGTFYFSNGSHLKGKINVNLENLQFNVTNVTNAGANTNIKFTITEGKILKAAAKASGTKSITDSIYFKLKGSDDPTTYVLAGFKKTKFLEDEH